MSLRITNTVSSPDPPDSRRIQLLHDVERLMQRLKTKTPRSRGSVQRRAAATRLSSPTRCRGGAESTQGSGLSWRLASCSFAWRTAASSTSWSNGLATTPRQTAAISSRSAGENTASAFAVTTT